MNETKFVDMLLVEDNPDELHLAQRALEKVNVAFKVYIARDGEEALQFLFCEGAHGTRQIEDGPKVILLDLKLPKVDGLGVLKRIRSDARTQAIPVVVLTSSQEQRDVVESYRLGANGYVVKPVYFEGFVAAIQDIALYWVTWNQQPK